MTRPSALRRVSLCYTERVMRLLAIIMAASMLAAFPTDGLAAKKRARGKLKIEATVDGANVKVNGLPAGKTPMKAIRLKAGKYTVRVEKLGHLAFETEVIVKGGRLAQVLADLLPVSGVLDVRIRPHGARILIDGKVVGKSPATLELNLGKRQIEIAADGHLSLHKEVNALPGEWVELKGWLEASGEDPLGDDLALVPLSKPTPDPLEDELALVPLARPAKKSGTTVDDLLDLEPLVPLTPLPPADKASGFSPTDVTTTIADREEWYESWWVWGGAGAVVVSSAVLTALMLSGGESGVAVDSILDLSESSPTSW